MKKHDIDSAVEHALGSLGLLLILLTVWAVERLQSGAPMDAGLARLVLGWVTAIGWVVDRVPLPYPQRPARNAGGTGQTQFVRVSWSNPIEDSDESSRGRRGRWPPRAW